MRILIDVDGVVANLHYAWLRRYNKEYDDNLQIKDIVSWAMHGLVKPECGKKIYSYLDSPTLYDEVPEIEGAAEGVRKIRKLGHEIVFVSSGFYPAKVKWLADHGFVIDFPYGDGRWQTARDVVLTSNKGIIMGDILIDDYPVNLNGFTGDTFMFDQPWNWDEGRFRRIFNWENIYKVIRDEYPKPTST